MEENVKNRAIDCEILSSTKQLSIDEYSKVLKDDWNIRAITDAASYVCANQHASEEAIQGSGKHDFEGEYLPRIKKYFGYSGVHIENVLEIGCGFGRMSQFIASTCYNLYALDISGELLNIAEKRLGGLCGNILFIEGDGYNLNKIPDNSIDVAFEYICFQHIPFASIIKSYIHEVGRVLKKDGIFIMHGRDISGSSTGSDPGNTWHGVRISPAFVDLAILGTQLFVYEEEAIETDRYWCILKKR
jgi:SAM-dependent methyltransferase